MSSQHHDYAASPSSPLIGATSPPLSEAGMSPPQSPPQPQYRGSRLGNRAPSVLSHNTAGRGSLYRGQGSMMSGSFILNTSAYTRPFSSRRIEPGVADRPWTKRPKSKASKLISAIPLVGLALGLIIVGIYGYTGYRDYETVPFCPYWEDDFSNGLDDKIWSREVQLDGFGTSEFEWMTPYENNSFVQDGQLHIKPTLTWVNETEGLTLNLTTMGICTGTTDTACAATRNTTAGTYIPPVQSARLTTRIGKSIRYGKVEVTAKMPIGDWLWPAIWMMPVDSKYGIWPASGEIDIAEGRGNPPSYYTVAGGDPGAVGAEHLKHFPAGNNAIGSALHWGPESWADGYSKTTNGFHYPSAINDLTDSFHVYGMEWTPEGIRTYVDQQLTQITYFKFPSTGFWDFGSFPSNLVNPWFGGTKATPFDQDFYLILNVAIGGTNGYFADRVGNKPWSNGLTRDQAMKQFSDSRDAWLPSWTQPELIIDKVVMMKTCQTY